MHDALTATSVVSSIDISDATLKDAIPESATHGKGLRIDQGHWLIVPSEPSPYRTQNPTWVFDLRESPRLDAALATAFLAWFSDSGGEKTTLFAKASNCGGAKLAPSNQSEPDPPEDWLDMLGIIASSTHDLDEDTCLDTRYMSRPFFPDPEFEASSYTLVPVIPYLFFSIRHLTSYSTGEFRIHNCPYTGLDVCLHQSVSWTPMMAANLISSFMWFLSQNNRHRLQGLIHSYGNTAIPWEPASFFYDNHSAVLAETTT